MSFLVFAIHTVPDIETGAKKYNLGDLDDKSALKAMMHLYQQSGKDELPHYMQRIVAISMIFRGKGVTLELNTISDDVNSEAVLLRNFFKNIAKYTVPTLISWNSKDVDMPILKYRCIKHEISIPHLIATPPLSLTHEISSFYAKASTSQENIMSLLGLEYEPAFSTETVWRHWGKGELELIKNNCTFKALNSYRVYLRYQLLIGEVTHSHFRHESERIEKWIIELTHTDKTT